MEEPQERGVLSLGWEDPLEEKMATLSSILAGIIIYPCGELQGKFSLLLVT